jgi:vitamin B12/bleomycin/antimicrobial peptide transport system ATP-binding/permease protein
MSSQPPPFDLQTLRRLIRAINDLLTSEVRRKAIVLQFFLLAFGLSVNGLNVASSYVGRDFMTAIAHRDMSDHIGESKPGLAHEANLVRGRIPRITPRNSSVTSLIL